MLKLGDFGIAAHPLSRRGVTADAFNLFHVDDTIDAIDAIVGAPP